MNGKPYLNAQNATYSYGNLQLILEMAIRDMYFQNVENALLLGLGGGSIVHSLRKKFNYRENIVCVEVDQKMIDIARKEFKLTRFSKLEIVHNDAFDYVLHCKGIFDLVFIDVFIDLVVPDKFYSFEFISNVEKLLSSKSRLVFNMGVGEIEEAHKNLAISFFKEKNYHLRLLENTIGSNTILIAERRKQK